MGSAYLMSFAKQFGDKIQHRGPVPEEATLSLPHEVIYVWPNWLFSLKTCDLITLRILFPNNFLASVAAAAAKSLQIYTARRKECISISIYPLYIGPKHCPISSCPYSHPFQNLKDPGLLTLIKWFSNGQSLLPIVKGVDKAVTLGLDSVVVYKHVREIHKIHKQ